MVAAVLVMLISSRKANPVPEITGLHLIPALVILLREIIVSGLREYLAGLQVSIPVSALAKWKTTLLLVALGALILAAELTLITGYDFLRAGLRHMEYSILLVLLTKESRFLRSAAAARRLSSNQT